jgi:hypothetical protein
MHREKFLIQLKEALSNKNEVKKVKIKYKNGETIKIIFYNNDNDDDNKENDKYRDEEDIIEKETLLYGALLEIDKG